MKKVIIKNAEDYQQRLIIESASRLKEIIVIGRDDMEVSDGYHTFDELYDHRITLFIALARSMEKVHALAEAWREMKGTEKAGALVWRSKKHSDGELSFGGTWFVFGIGKKEGEQITYHLPIERWDETEFAETLEQAPEFDGHSSQDVLERLKTL